MPSPSARLRCRSPSEEAPSCFHLEFFLPRAGGSGAGCAPPEPTPCPVCRPSVRGAGSRALRSAGSVMLIQMRAFPARWDPFPTPLLPSLWNRGGLFPAGASNIPAGTKEERTPMRFGQGCAQRARQEFKDVAFAAQGFISGLRRRKLYWHE